jgi:plastocyanin
MKQSKERQFVHFSCTAVVLLALACFSVLKTTPSAAQVNGTDAPVGHREAAPADSPSQVVIDNFVYSPVPLTVKVGTQVSWVNHDDIPHTVDSTQGKFKSQALDTDDKFEFKFTEPGEYPFYCRIHPKMTGKIIVQP